MEMSKAVGEFIAEQAEKRIYDVYSSQLKELERKGEEEKKKWFEAIKTFIAEENKKLDDFLELFGYAPPKGKEKFYAPFLQVRSFYSDYLPAQIAYREFSHKVSKKISDTIRDITVTMELGGTKAELMEMLNNIDTDI